MNSLKAPFESFHNQLYFNTLIKTYKNYIEHVDKLSKKNSSINLASIKKITDTIQKTINLYLTGNSGESYTLLTELLDKKEVDAALMKISPTDSQPISLYKVRSGKSILSRRTEIFHLPFNQRHMVKNYRYSIPGVPSLYLGSSIYICWIELNQPPLSELWVSKYLFDSKGRTVIDLSFSIDEKINEFNDKKITVSSLNNYLKIWPIIIACSFKTKYPEAHFHEEYVIPNMILQWIKRDRPEIIGLKFISTKSKVSVPEVCTNYVFPSSPQETENPNNYCDSLKSYFRLTYPLPWSMLDTLPKPDVIAGGENSFKAKKVQEVIINNYDLTDFKMIERLIDNFEIRKIPIEKKK